MRAGPTEVGGRGEGRKGNLALQHRKRGVVADYPPTRPSSEIVQGQLTVRLPGGVWRRACKRIRLLPRRLNWAPQAAYRGQHALSHAHTRRGSSAPSTPSGHSGSTRISFHTCISHVHFRVLSVAVAVGVHVLTHVGCSRARTPAVGRRIGRPRHLALALLRHCARRTDRGEQSENTGSMGHAAQARPCLCHTWHCSLRKKKPTEFFLKLSGDVESRSGCALWRRLRRAKTTRKRRGRRRHPP